MKFFMCYVEGRDSPKHKHADSTTAHVEAVRLARLPENIGREVHVLMEVNSCKVELKPIIWKYGVN